MKDDLFFPWGKEAPSFFPQGKKRSKEKGTFSYPFSFGVQKKTVRFFLSPEATCFFLRGSAFFLRAYALYFATIYLYLDEES